MKIYALQGKKMTPIHYLSLIFSVTGIPSILAELNSLVFNSKDLLLLALVIVVLLGYILNKNQVKSMQNISEKTLQIKDKVLDQVQEQTTEMTAAAQEKINLIIEEYQKFLPYAGQLGLKVNSFSIEAGVLPQIKTSLKGSIHQIKIEVIEQIKTDNTNNKLLIAVLNAILIAKKSHDALESVYISLLKDIIIDIKLGIPPAISVRFQ